MNRSIVAGENRVFERPFKSLPCYVNAQNHLLTWLTGKAAPVHHPVERRLDPCHSRHAERRNKRSSIKRSLRDFWPVRLIDTYRRSGELSADDVLLRHDCLH